MFFLPFLISLVESQITNRRRRGQDHGTDGPVGQEGLEEEGEEEIEGRE